jgi:hypothetical protein
MPVSHITSGAVTINDPEWYHTQVCYLMEFSGRDINSLTGIQEFFLSAEAHLTSALKYEIYLFLLLAMPRNLTSLRFQRNIAHAKGGCLQR